MGKVNYTVSSDGTEYWTIESSKGKLWHRSNGLPAIIHPDGREVYYEHGVKHRECGPAVTLCIPVFGTMRKLKEWWVRGTLVRSEPAKPFVSTIHG